MPCRAKLGGRRKGTRNKRSLEREQMPQHADAATIAKRPDQQIRSMTPCAGLLVCMRCNRGQTPRRPLPATGSQHGMFRPASAPAKCLLVLDSPINSTQNPRPRSTATLTLPNRRTDRSIGRN